MKTAEEIQDEYAQEKGFDNFYCLIVDDKKSIDYHTRNVQELYAEQFKPKWIDVKDQMPESFRAVLLFCDYIGTNHMCEIDTVGCWQMDHWTTDRDNDLDKEEIIVHKWMPLPE